MPMPASWSAVATVTKPFAPMRPSIKFFPTIPSSRRRSPTSSRANPSNRWSRMREQGAAEVLYGLGAAGGQQGDELAAMIYLRLALYLTPHNSLAIITLGDLCERIKQNEQAIDVYGMVRGKRSPAHHGRYSDRPDSRSAWAARTKPPNISNGSSTKIPKNEDALSALGNLQRAHKQYARGDRHLFARLGREEQARENRLGRFIISGAFPTSARRNGRKRRPTSCRPSRFIPISPSS